MTKTDDGINLYEHENHYSYDLLKSLLNISRKEAAKLQNICCEKYGVNSFFELDIQIMGAILKEFGWIYHKTSEPKISVYDLFQRQKNCLAVLPGCCVTNKNGFIIGSVNRKQLMDCMGKEFVIGFFTKEDVSTEVDESVDETVDKPVDER